MEAVVWRASSRRSCFNLMAFKWRGTSAWSAWLRQAGMTTIGSSASVRADVKAREILPWWNYFLGLIRAAYREFEIQVESSAARPAKGDLVRRTVLAQLEEFTLADLSTQLPSASRQLIKKVLSDLKKRRQRQARGQRA
jgi:hypothetical protein